MNFLKKIFGSSTPVNYAELVKNGAVIIDVRTQGEFQGGHIKGALNIPLDSLKNNLTKIKKGSVVITCCASGMRSASAKSMLKSNGFTEVHNGGGWMKLQRNL